MLRVASLISLLMMGVAALSSVTAQEELLPRLRFGSGSPSAFYHSIGEQLEAQSTIDDIRITNVATHGSWANLKALESGDVDLALSQVDTAILFTRLTPATSFRAVTVTFHDTLHILVRDPLVVRDFSQLRGLRIWMGEKGSGTELTARRFLDLIGLPPSSYQRVEDPTPRELHALLSNSELDVVLFVGAPGTPFIAELLRSRLCTLQPVDTATARLLLFDTSGNESHRSNIVASIPRDTYPHQPREIQSLMVPVVLMAHPDVKDSYVENVVGRLRALKADLPSDYLAAQPTTTLDLASTGLALYPDYKRFSPMIDWRRIANLGFIVLFVLVALQIIYRKRTFLLRAFRRHLTSAVVVSAVLVVLMCGMGAYLAETRVNANFQSVFESLWSIVLYILSGLEDRGPVTIGGRIFATIALLAGPVLAALLTGVFASTLVLHSLERRMTKNLSGHYLILNWGDKAKEVIRQLHAPILDKSVIAVVTDDPALNLKAIHDEVTRSSERAIFEDVFFSAGDPTDEFALLNANALDAKAIVILAAPSATATADERTIRSIVTLKRIAQRGSRKDLHVVAEFTRLENVRIGRELSTDFPGTLETVALGEVLTLLLASAAMNTGLIDVYRDLLSTTADSNEIYSVELPSTAAGKSFRDYAASVIGTAPAAPIIPIGIRRMTDKGPSIVLNPNKEGSASLLCTGDELIVIAYRPPSVSDLPA